MRTTLTLEEEFAKLIERIRKRRGATLRDVVNEALREGLPQLEAPARPRKRHQTKPVSRGGCLLGDLDDVAEVLAVAKETDSTDSRRHQPLPDPHVDRWRLRQVPRPSLGEPTRRLARGLR